jgi:hypothetical protein
VVEGARLESVFRGNSNVGSNPTLSAKFFYFQYTSVVNIKVNCGLLPMIQLFSFFCEM